MLLSSIKHSLLSASLQYDRQRMHLLYIDVDGFKSYATATRIGEFDPSFNAITGLNGSGKSNILDAICFAMGIKALNAVRVSNLQELIYKQGTAGITKASVTLTFDNSDPKQSPNGYAGEKLISVTRQISVSAPCKYMINGRKALATEVSDMFQSVQLNVNNPHFLIMQGRITKVLNMKPEEIRDMLQEALGTLMYENKKFEAQKKMSQKESKVQAIKDTLETQITPKIEKLREEKRGYDRYNAVVQELQRHHRFIVAFDFYSKVESTKEGRKEFTQIADDIEAAKTTKKTALVEEKAATKELEEKKKKREQEASKPFKQAEDDEKQASQDLVRVSASKDSALEDLKAEKNNAEQNKLRVEEVTQLSIKCESDAVKAKENVETEKENVINQRNLAEKARQGVESAETGAADLLQQELMEEQKKDQESRTKLKISELTIKTKTEETKKVDSEYRKSLKEETQSNQISIEKLVEEVAQVKAKMDALPTKTNETSNITELKPQAKDLRSSCAHLTNFKFDASALPKGGKCFGRLAGLIRLDSSKSQSHARAMEVTAGGKLFQIVVDSKETAKQLLKNGRLNQRITVIPLDSVSARVADREKCEYASTKAKKEGGWCSLALDVLDRSAIAPEVWVAMEFAFGQTLICDSMKTAKQLTFDDAIKMKCVTLDGDLLDPSGTLTGGSRQNSTQGNPPLFDLQLLYELEEKISKLELEESRMETVEKERNVLLKELNRAQHELDMAQARQAETKSQRLAERLKEIENELATAMKEKEDSKQAMDTCSKRIAELKDSLNNSQSRKEKLVAEAKKMETAAKKSLKKAEEAELAALKRVEEVESTRRQCLDELKQLSENISKQNVTIEEMEKKCKKLTAESEQAKEKYQKLKSIRMEKEQALQSWDSSFQELENQALKANEKARELDIELKKLEARQQKLKNDVKAAEDSIILMKKEHLWIEKEQQFFGREHTEYDFEIKDPVLIRQQYKELEQVQAELSKTINKKVFAMMEKSEEEYESLDKKRKAIETDRIAIERVIAGLDRKKNEALISTYEKVNKDFGSIFSTLLPGARAELKPVEGGTVLDGLEVRVAFGQTWKESLAELSGGQRSLLALSLVLALLRFKPAPLYILDEIDAALDLSHTQNIGVMLREHFSESQFIVVSLKEGMFANASCLFRTKFVDGISTVTRTVNRAPAPSKVNNNNGSKKRLADDIEEEA